MARTLWKVMAAGMLSLCMTSCGSGGGGSGSDVCSKLQSCNFLAGTSVAQCTDSFNKEMAGLTSSERADMQKALDQCMSLSDCANFASCLGIQ